MQWKDQQVLFEQFVNGMRDLQQTKGREYASDTDSLANFKAGERIGISPLQKSLVFAEKHWFSVQSYARLGKELSNETIEGRLLDLANYVFLMYAIVQETKAQQSQSKEIVNL